MKTRAHLISVGKMVLSGAFCILFVVSCSSTATDPPEVAELPLPDRFTADTSGSPTTTDPVYQNWWQGFQSQGLNAAIETGLQQNFNLKAAAAQLQQAELQVTLATGKSQPSVAAGLRAGRSRQNFFGLPIPGAPDVIPITSSSMGLSLDVSWELDLWGRLQAEEDAAYADYLASSATYQGARLSLAGQTAKAWFSLIEAQTQYSLALELENLTKQWLGHVQIRFSAGSARASQLLAIETAYQNARATRLARELQQDRLRRSLESLMAGYPEGKFKPGATELPGSLPNIPLGLPAELIARRPDLIAAQARYQASRARSEVAQASLYPRLSLTTSGGTSSNQLSDLLNGDFQVWSLAGGLVAPLFQGGRLRAQVEIQQSGEQAAAFQFAQQTLLALAEVEGTLFAEQSLRRQSQTLEQAQAEQLQNWQSTQRRFQAGAGDLPTWIQARQSLLQAQSQTLALRLQLLLNRVDLHLALGGNFATATTTDA